MFESRFKTELREKPALLPRLRHAPQYIAIIASAGF
jgi:hypothetical protein